MGERDFLGEAYVRRFVGEHPKSQHRRVGCRGLIVIDAAAAGQGEPADLTVEAGGDADSGPADEHHRGHHGVRSGQLGLAQIQPHAAEQGDAYGVPSQPPPALAAQPADRGREPLGVLPGPESAGFPAVAQPADRRPVGRAQGGVRAA